MFLAAEHLTICDFILGTQEKTLLTDSVQSMVTLLRIRKHRLSHDIYALRRVAYRARCRCGRTIGEITI